MTEAEMKKKMCPIISAGRAPMDLLDCRGSNCALWEWDEPLYDGPDSYVSEPGPEGHCGLVLRHRKIYGEV